MLREGGRVAYVGADAGSLRLGDQGTLLSVSGAVAHVRWDSGAAGGQVSAHYETDLTTLAPPREVVACSLEDSLEVGGLVSFAVRDTFDSGGESAVLNAMAEAGHLAAFADIAQEALDLVSARIRRDASFQAVLADLDPEESEDVVRLASICLVRDAFTTDD